MIKRITVDLSEDATAYFEEIASSLDIPNPDASDVVNYVFKTLNMMEAVTGDPLEFLRALAKGEKMIIDRPKKISRCPYCESVSGHTENCPEYKTFR